MPVYEILKIRIMVKVQERLDPGKSRRMPPLLFQQTARTQVEQVVEAEAARLSKSERDRLVDEVYREAFGYGPLEELFDDHTVQEIMVLGPHVVVVRRESGWQPTNVKFRDAEQLQDVLDRTVGSGEGFASGLGFSAMDVRLPNGFRALSIIPPDVLDQPTYAIFVRVPVNATLPPPLNTPGTGAYPAVKASPSLSNGTAIHPLQSSMTKSTSSTGSVMTASPVGSSTSSPAPGEQQLARYRARITERIIAKLASLGVYDVSRLDAIELRRVIAAYVEEYFRTEKIFISDADQGRLTLEILTAMKP